MKRLILLASLVFLAGCATIGNRQIENQENVAQIKIGMSCKVDVQKLVGEPMKTTFSDNGEETWDYVLTKSKMRAASLIPIVGIFAGGADMETQTLTIRFTKEGIVKEIGKGKMNGGGGSVLD
jgi:outer membrane protein assembly factor BamE (lipoprotein component of BamABCDE complex)